MHKKKLALITGINGQDGAYLANFLLKKNYRVHGLDKRGAPGANFEYFGIKKKILLHRCDIRNEKALTRLLGKLSPSEIYNFAARSFVGDSWKNVKELNEINYFGLINLLEAMQKICPQSKLVQASTSEMFGSSNENGLQTEETPFHPRSPYAISKLAAYEIANNYRESYGLFVCNAICFNHESPLRPPNFVTRKISLGVAKISLGLEKHIELGNLDSVRDWGFAGDYVEAMWLMLQQKKPDNFILSTGANHSIKDLLNVAFKEVGIKNWLPYVRISSQFRRPVELKRLIGSNAKAKRILGWQPKHRFEEIVRLMVREDLKRLRSPVRP